MTVNEAHTELLFSYGTLQLEAVQMATLVGNWLVQAMLCEGSNQSC